MCKKKMEDGKRFPDNLLMDFSLLLAMNHDLCGNSGDATQSPGCSQEHPDLKKKKIYI